MQHRTGKWTIAAAALVLVLGACREDDGPSGPGGSDVRVFITSDPSGARIFVNNRNTAQVTPDTVGFTLGEHGLSLRLDSAGYQYSYSAAVRITSAGNQVPELHAPLTVNCPPGAPASCRVPLRRYYEAAGLRFAGSALGSLFYWTGNGQGLFWPASSTNSFVSRGMPMFAAMDNTLAVALGMYDEEFLVGRPAPLAQTSSGAFRLTQRTWVVPPLHPAVNPRTVRGLEIAQEVIGRDDLEGVLLLRLTFRNISAEPLLASYAPHLPPGGVTFTAAFIGFALDVDIGAASDDWVSYDRALDMAFAYDANFAEADFFAGANASPGLVGLRALRAPAGTTVMLNSWPSGVSGGTGDWTAGTTSDARGYGVVSGAGPYLPQHADPRIGHLPAAPGDMRIAVTAGPLTLAPGQAAEIVLAIAVAEPAPGTYTSGTILSPGDPLDTTRALYAVAARLREKMLAAESLLS